MKEVAWYVILSIVALMGNAANSQNLINACGAIAVCVWLKGLLYSAIDEIAIKTADEIQRRGQSNKNARLLLDNILEK